ncbi:hypothetical protein H2199_006965 [Coniosporium tulheliwenetii]|uniref:Uncharacterized protein n=1 Tax=Coniosporium tulheliwenetii TaxID=3383036 RepID=A0ACC2YSG0_9PEZI|nr:hypothetical protein H2199_006965 [Cladosporium sp. JES 115]
MAIQRSVSQSSLPSELSEFLSRNKLSLSSASSTTISDDSSAKSRVQNVWDTAFNKSMGVPDGYGYEDVAVLIIKWDDQLDDLNHRPEIQLNLDVAQFIADHDGPHKLMIVFYTGHSSWTDSDGLELYAKGLSERNANGNTASARWKFADGTLMDGPRGDVLAIFDSCFASNVQKGVTNDARTYTFIAASSYNRATAAPGKNSFTAALIKSLRELLDKHDHGPFTVHDLAAQINRQKERHRNPCLVHTRLEKNGDRFVRLAPLPPEADRAARKQSFHKAPYRTFLTLRLAFTNETLNDDQIRDLAPRISKACADTGVQARRIDVVGYRDSIKHNRVKIVQLVIAGASRLRALIPNSATSERQCISQLPWDDIGTSSAAIPCMLIPQSAPDTTGPLPASSSAQEDRTPASGEMIRARRSLGQIEINTALQVLLMIFLIVEFMSQAWWRDILTNAQDRAKDLQEVVNALLAQAQARNETTTHSVPFMPGFVDALKRWGTW